MPSSSLSFHAIEQSQRGKLRLPISNTDKDGDFTIMSVNETAATDFAAIEVHHDFESEIELQDNNEDEPTDDIDTPCWRMCPRRINRIYYDDGPAGLGDRKTIIRDLSELAGYLCAKIILPRPNKLLNRGHNFGELLSDELQWDDFVNITFAEDGESAIVHDEFEVKRTDERYKGFHWIKTTDKKWSTDFEKVHSISWNQNQGENPATGFVWELHTNFYSNDLMQYKLPMLSMIERKNLGDEYKPSMMEPIRYSQTEKWFQRNKCHYTNEDTTPSHVNLMQEKLEVRILKDSLEDSLHGLLHLRRGDVVDVCDTSIERMEEYFSCSLNNTAHFGNITLLMTSDEEDEFYRQSIKNLAVDYEHVTILDVDEMIWGIVDEAVGNGDLSSKHQNNYFVYEIGNMLRTWKTDGLVKFYLVRRRSMCTECIPVEKRINKLFGF